MNPKFAQVLKWIGCLDGAVIAGAVAFGRTAPQYQAVTDTIVEIGGSITTVLGVVAHLQFGSQTVKS